MRIADDFDSLNKYLKQLKTICGEDFSKYIRDGLVWTDNKERKEVGQAYSCPYEVGCQYNVTYKCLHERYCIVKKLNDERDLKN